MTPTWQQVEVSLDAWDPEPVRQAVLDALIGAMPSPGPAVTAPNERWPYSQAVRTALGASAGRWYELGPTVGDETVTEWCWCHAFWRPFDGTPGSVRERLEAVTDGVMAEVERCRTWRLGLAGHLRALPRGRPLDDVLLERDLVALVGVLVGLGIHDSWYQHVHVAAGWMLQARGHPVTDALVEQIGALCEVRFSSWCDPKPADRQGFASDSAWAIIEALLPSG